MWANTKPGVVTLWRCDDEWQANLCINATTYRVQLHCDPKTALEKVLGFSVSDEVVAQVLEFSNSLRKENLMPRGVKGSGTPKAPKAKKADAAPIIDSALLSRVRFVNLASDVEGREHYQSHVMMNNRTLIAFNGVLAAGVMIDEDITAAPHTATLLKALDKAGPKFSAVADGSRLSIKADKFKAVVPCADPGIMPVVAPDPWMGPLTDTIRDAFKACGALASDNATHVLTSSLLIHGQSVVATDRHVMVEYWHGNNMPTLVIPRMFATAVLKASEELAGFGFSNTSVTFYFKDNSFLKSQLWSEPWPENWQEILPTSPDDFGGDPVPIGSDFWEAFDAIESFSEEGFVYISPSSLRTHRDPEAGASFELKGFNENQQWALGVKRLKLIRPLIKQIGQHRTNALGFFGDNVRGAIATAIPAPVQEQPTSVGYTPEQEEMQEDPEFVQQPGVADAYAAGVTQIGPAWN